MILSAPTPLLPLDLAAFTSKKTAVWVKRDDLAHPFISGNKGRKLKYILSEARAAGKNHLVTFGGAFSNHLLATAAAAAEQGLQATGFVRGEKVENDTLFLCRLVGMKLIFTARESYRDKQGLFCRYFSGDSSAYFIDEGGAGEAGAKGCEEIVAELGRDFDHLVCACGTGTTAAGIMNGLTAAGKNTRVHLIPVLKDAGFLEAAVNTLLRKPATYELHTNYHFGGYAKTTPELISFSGKFIRKTGIIVDPVYTAKAFYALCDLIEKGAIKEGETAVVIHTGGSFGLLGMKEKFS